MAVGLIWKTWSYLWKISSYNPLETLDNSTLCMGNGHKIVVRRQRTPVELSKAGEKVGYIKVYLKYKYTLFKYHNRSGLALPRVYMFKSDLLKIHTKI